MASSPPAVAAPPAPAPAPAASVEAESGVIHRLVLTFSGGALVLNGLLAAELGVYDPQLAQLSTLLGALLLAAPIVRRAWDNLRRDQLDLDELIALAVVAAIAVGNYLAAGAVAFFALLGELVERRTALGARVAIESLVRLTPTTARRLLPGGETEEVEAAALAPGERVLVLPGDNVPADGEVESGRSTVDQASITGESLPADKKPGDEVFAGTSNLTGALEVRVARAGGETTLGRVKELILAAESSRPPVARIIDRYVSWYLPVVLMLAFIILFFTGDQTRFIAALVVACPTAIVLATPTAMVAALSCAARLGILVKDARDLEVASKLTSVLFDKTGTLTTGDLAVVQLDLEERDVGVGEEHDPAELLQLAAAVAARSTHPASRAVVAVAQEAELPALEAEEVEEVPGLGVIGLVGGRRVVLGRRQLLVERGLHAPAEAGEAAGGEDDGGEAPAPRALSRIYVGIDGHCWGTLGLEDQVRAQAGQAVRDLRRLGVRRLSIMTGDRRAVARKVALELGMDDVAAECLPSEKLELAQAAKARGEVIAVVGDGVNDAPALAAGDLGLAMGAAGSDVAIGSARVALMNNDLRRVPFLIELSRRTRAVVAQNLVVGGALLASGLALAGAGLLTPVWAIILHNLGSLFVVFNSARLIRLGEELS